MRWLLSAVLFAVSCQLPLFGQSFGKDIRQTYLWDVTLSMKGYQGAPDIYDTVRDQLVEDIERIDDDRTEIVVMPFQDTKYCEKWTAVATPAGKKELVAKIKAYNNEKITNTNLGAPLEYVIDNVLSADKLDIVKIMTDGACSGKYQNLFEKQLDRWCGVANEKVAFGLYITLTSEAKTDFVVRRLNNICRMNVVDVTGKSGIDIFVVVMVPQEHVTLNVKDDYDKAITLQVFAYGNGAIPDGYKLRVSADNEYMSVDEVAEIEGGRLSVTPHWKKTRGELHQILSDDHPTTILLQYEDVMNPAPDDPIVVLSSERTLVDMINKTEKTLKFHVVKDE